MSDNKEEETFQLSVKEFNRLQETLVRLRTENFELKQNSGNSPSEKKSNDVSHSKAYKALESELEEQKNIVQKYKREKKELLLQQKQFEDLLEKEKRAKSKVVKEQQRSFEKLRNDLNGAWKKKYEQELKESKRKELGLLTRTKEEIRKAEVKSKEDMKKQELRLKEETKKIEKNFQGQISALEKRVSFFKKKKNSHKKKKKEARFQVQELNKKLQTQRTQIKSLEEEIEKKTKYIEDREHLQGDLNKKIELSEQLQRENDSLKKDLERVEKKLSDSKKSETKTKKKSHRKLKALEQKNLSHLKEIEKNEKIIVSYLVYKSLTNVILAKEEKSKRKYKAKSNELSKRVELLEETQMNLKKDNEEKRIRLGEIETEHNIEQRQNRQLIKDLRAHLKHTKKKLKRISDESKKKEEEIKTQLKKLRNNSNNNNMNSEEYGRKGRDIERENTTTMTTPQKSESNHSSGSRKRSSSRSSSKSSSRSSKRLFTSSPVDTSFSQIERNQILERTDGDVKEFILSLTKDNENLIKKIAILQQKYWKLEDAIRLLQDRVFVYEEEIQNKKKIIENYALREKMGRLSAVQEKKYQEVESPRKRNYVTSLLGLGSNKQKKEDKVGFERVHQVLEETLMKNIQLQDNMRIMGEEVQRLLEENKKLLEMRTKEKEKE